MPLYTKSNLKLPLPNEMSKEDKDGRSEAEAFLPNVVSKSYPVKDLEEVKVAVAAHFKASKYSGFYAAEGGEGNGLVLRLVMLNPDEARSLVAKINKRLKDEGAFRVLDNVTERNQKVIEQRLNRGFEASSEGLRSFFGLKAKGTKRVIDHVTTREAPRVTREDLTP